MRRNSFLQSKVAFLCISEVNSRPFSVVFQRWVGLTGDWSRFECLSTQLTAKKIPPTGRLWLRRSLWKTTDMVWTSVVIWCLASSPLTPWYQHDTPVKLNGRITFYTNARRKSGKTKRNTYAFSGHATRTACSKTKNRTNCANAKLKHAAWQCKSSYWCD